MWRIFLLLRADRFYLIFSTGLKIRLLVRDFFRLLLPGVLGFSSPATNPVQQLTFLLSISADGKESPLPFWGPSQSFGFSLLPFRVRRPEWGPQVQTSVGLHCDPHSFLTVILWRLATVNSNTRIVVILFLSSQWDTTWQMAIKGYSAFPQSFGITRASPSDCFVSYLGHSLGESYLPAEMQLVYFAAPANWASGPFWHQDLWL